ncbi:MAG: hypothetical protein MJ252_04565 [archaeon]|nr:hypothetical protein [archaeon]
MSTEQPIPEISIFNNGQKFAFKRGNENYTIFNKQTNEFERSDVFEKEKSKEEKVFMILGYIEALKNGYIVAAKKVKYMGKIITAKIYKITKFVYIPKSYISKTPSDSKDILTTPKDDLNQFPNTPEEDLPYLKMLDDFLDRNNLLYSETLDLTRNIKSYENTTETSKSIIFPYTKSNFCWNYSMEKLFDVSDMINLIFPVINGFFGIADAKEYNENMEYFLIARKDTRRSGMRFHIRGADENGNCANFVETEEVFVLKGEEKISLLSFLIIRGSMPLIWTQDPNFQLNPKIIPIPEFQVNSEVFGFHAKELLKNYSSVLCVNLIDKKKDQKNIGEYYQNLSKQYNEKESKKLDYVWFDFHSECKKMKYENLSKLLKEETVRNAMEHFDYTLMEIENIPSDLNDLSQFLESESNFTFQRMQKGVFRVNCVDCLDRCNVAQSVLSRYYAHIILSSIKLGEEPKGDALQKFKTAFEQNFKNLWADHGDIISICYSGTCALKGDFTRTGKRSLMGALADGYYTCHRFYINNLRDGYNQDCHDYFLGTIDPKKTQFKKHDMKSVVIMFPIVLILSLITYFILTGMALSPVEKGMNEGCLRKLLKMILFLIAFGGSFFTVFTIMKDSLLDFHTKHRSNKTKK